MEKIYSFINKHEKLVFGIIILLFCLVFFSSYFFTTFPASEGWGQYYSDLVSAGKMPYKDFYYYLPPYNLIFDILLWKFAFGHFMLYCFYRFLERMLMIYLLYHLLCKVVKPRYACLGLCAGISMFGAVVYDIIGDYNQTSFLLTVIITLLYCNYMKNFNKNNKKQYLLLFLSGLFIGLSFLLKQPLFLAECLLFFPMITLNFVLNHKKNYFKSLFVSILGIMIPIIITCIILELNGALKPFINQVYLGSTNKGSLYQIITVIIRVCCQYKFLLASSLIFYTFYKYNKCKQTNYYLKNIDSIIIYIFITLISIYLTASAKIDSLNQLLASKVGIICVVGLLITFVIDKLTNKKLKNNSSIMSVIYSGFFIFLMLVLIIKPAEALITYYSCSSFSLLDDICTICTCGAIILSGYCVYLNQKNKEKNSNILIWEFIFVGSIVYEYAMQMGSNSIHNMGCVMIISSLFALIFQQFGSKNIFIKYVMITLTTFICITSISQKVSNAYSWWGWNEETLTPAKKYSIDIPGLEGYRVSKNVKNMYEKMYRVIDENTNENSVIYGFPYIKIFNVLLNNTNMNTFVPVPFYDVVSDEYARKDAIKLKNNPPDIVIWMDIDNCMEVHERVYRGGQPLGQRDIQKWFSKAVDNKEYILIGQYDNIFIYKLDDGSKIKYKYIKNKEAVNKTIKINKKQSKTKKAE